MQGIHHNFIDRSRHAQFNNDPIVPLASASRGFPAIAHVFRASRAQQVPHRSKVLVTACECSAAVFHGSQVNHFIRFDLTPVIVHPAIDTQTGDPAIRIDVQSHMAPGPARINCENMVRIAIEV